MDLARRKGGVLRLPKLSQRGAIHLIILFLLLAGIAGGVYLVNKSGFLTFKPKAASTGTRIEFFGTGVSQDKLSTTSQTININTYYIAPSPSPSPSSAPLVYNPKVLLLIYNPILKSKGNQKLTTYAQWNNPDTLTSDFINDVKRISKGAVNYTIVERKEIDGFPTHEDGFTYTEDSYLACSQSKANCHKPDMQDGFGYLADYKKMILDSGACTKRDNSQIDELWIFGGPYFGYWESNLAGINAFNYNSPPTLGTTCQKLLPIMGFSYHVGKDLMLHDLGHRLESTMAKAYGSAAYNSNNAWFKFSARESSSPGNGGCGNTHYPVNTSDAYQYSSTAVVQSTCEDFKNYPNLTGAKQPVSCTVWGCNQQGYLEWMFGRMPQAGGKTSDGILNNWWAYLVDPQGTLFPNAPQPSATPTVTASPTPAPSVQPSPQGPTITLNTQPPIIAGQIISVSWSGVSNPSVNDLIVVSRIGATLTRGTIFTSSCTTTLGTAAKSSGICNTFQLSTSNISDNFKLDLLQNGATNIASSAPFYLWATGSTPTSSPTATPYGIINPSPIGVGGSVKGVAYAQTAAFPTQVKLSNTQDGLNQPCPNGVTCIFSYSGNPTAVNNWKLTNGNGQKTVYAQFLSNNQPLGAIVSVSISFTKSPLPSSSPIPDSSPISDPSRGIPGDLIADIVLGHPDFNQAVPGEVVPFKVMNPGGVIVDRNASPNRIYVYDGANSRVLGYKSLGICSNNPSNVCTNQNDCGGASCNVSARKDADIIIGQAKGDYSGCNNDGNMVSYPNRAPASASKLCTTVPTQNSPREGGSYSNMFVDSSNNLYITDFHNNRVLKYIDPFKTDTVADEVWGQDDFTGFRCNKADGDIASASIPNPTAQTLCMGRNTKYQESFDAGVMLDHLGNMWVSDSSNHRVLRFPKQNGIAKTADLVLGQTNFTTRSNGQGLNQLKEPSGIKESSDGKIFVADKGNNRVLVFAPPFANGQSGTTFGSQFRSPSGLEFSPENDGLWVADGGNKMLELWSLDGSEVKKVLSKDTYQPNGNCGSATQNTVCINPQPDGRCHANLCEVYGSVGIDSVGNIYATASDGFQDMVRYPAPIPSPQLGKLLSSDKRFFSPPEGSNYLSDKGLADPQGITTGGDQLIVSDGRRILFWNNYKSLSSGKAADGFVGIDSINSFQSVDPWGIGRIRADKQNRLWVMRKSTIDVYQLPLVSGAHPIKQAAISFNNPLSVLGSSQKLTWKFKEDLSGLDFDKAGNLWLAQGSPGTYNVRLAEGNPGIHRVFRIRNPFNNPTVDVILGQASPAESSCNRILALDDYDAQAKPYGAAPNTLCKPGAVRIDAVGNVWVSDYSLEFHGNRRMLEFNASQFANISNTALMGPNADLVSPAVRAWEASFDSANHMVLGYDGQLGSFSPGLYTNPLQSLKTSAVPNLTLKDFFSHGYSSTFDSDDNLYITDLNRGRVLIYKKPFATVTPTSSPILTPTPVVVPCPAGALCVTLTPPAKSPHKSASGQVVIQDNKPSQKGLTQLKINGSVKGLDSKTSYRVYVCKAQDSCSSSGLMIFTTDSSGNGTIQKDAVVSSWTDPVSAFISVKIVGGRCNTPSNACLSAPVSFSTPPPSQPELPPVVTVPDCRADVNRDGYVNIKDVSLVIGCLGRETSQNNIVGLSCANADVNLDKSIDLKDISFVISKFGKKVDPGQCSILPDCRADVGRSGDVNGQDISQTIGCFGLVIGQKNTSGLPCANADVNQDGLIDQKDIQFISSKYGKKVDLKQCPNIPVPTVNSFLNLKSSATTATASFNFSYTGTAANYQVNMSTKSDMSWDVYLSFGGNKNSPVTVQNPSVKWDKYKCGATLYWQVLDSAKNIKSPIQQVIITCPDAKAKRIFVTSTIYNGNLGGLSGADAKCQTQANTAKLGGMWKAWLSDSKTAAKDRLTNYPGPYKLLNGVTVANNWRDLTDGSIQAAVNLSELKSGKNGWPWTGTNYDGNNSAWTSSSQYCNNWTSAWWWNSGIQGLTDTTGTKWSLNTSTSRCNSQSPLFCFEQ